MNQILKTFSITIMLLSSASFANVKVNIIDHTGSIQNIGGHATVVNQRNVPVVCSDFWLLAGAFVPKTKRIDLKNSYSNQSLVIAPVEAGYCKAVNTGVELYMRHAVEVEGSKYSVPFRFKLSPTSRSVSPLIDKVCKVKLIREPKKDIKIECEGGNYAPISLDEEEITIHFN